MRWVAVWPWRGRLYKFFNREAESPEQAILGCNAQPDLIQARRDFWLGMHELPPQPLPVLVLHAPSRAKQLQAIVSFKLAARLISRLAHHTLEIYKYVPMFVPLATTPRP